MPARFAVKRDIEPAGRLRGSQYIAPAGKQVDGNFPKRGPDGERLYMVAKRDRMMFLRQSPQCSACDIVPTRHSGHSGVMPRYL